MARSSPVWALTHHSMLSPSDSSMLGTWSWQPEAFQHLKCHFLSVCNPPPTQVKGQTHWARSQSLIFLLSQVGTFDSSNHIFVTLTGFSILILLVRFTHKKTEYWFESSSYSVHKNASLHRPFIIFFTGHEPWEEDYAQVLISMISYDTRSYLRVLQK